MIAAIENAILTQAKAAGADGRLGYRFNSLETYPDDWDAYLKEKAGQITAPALWTTFGGWREPIDQHPPRLAAIFGIVVLAENLRNEQATRHGDPKDPRRPGSYQLLEDMATLFAGNALGLDIEPLKIGAARFVARLAALKERKVSMIALELKTAFSLSPLIPFDQLDDYKIAHVNWDPPLHEAGPDAPDDANSDLTDHFTIETIS